MVAECVIKAPRPDIDDCIPQREKFNQDTIMGIAASSTSRHFLFKHWGRRTFPKFPFKLGHSPIKPTNIAERSNLLAIIFKPPEVTGQQSYIVCLSSGRALQSLSSQMAKSKSPVEPRLKVPKGRRTAEVRP